MKVYFFLFIFQSNLPVIDRTAVNISVGWHPWPPGLGRLRAGPIRATSSSVTPTKMSHFNLTFSKESKVWRPGQCGGGPRGRWAGGAGPRRIMIRSSGRRAAHTQRTNFRTVPNFTQSKVKVIVVVTQLPRSANYRTNHPCKRSSHLDPDLKI